MRVAYLDCIGGISGDMFVGALLDAGWPEEALHRSVAWLAPEIAQLRVERRMHHALQGLGIVVVPVHAHGGGHATDAGHVHVPVPARAKAQAHAHDHAHGGAPGAAPRRGLAEVTACLRDAPLESQVRDRALAVFRRLAEAEARAHGRSVDQIHFHEVGAVDAMVDIVATCQGLRDLEIERLHISPIPVGQGTIEAAHGRIPLPAPATAHLLRGVPIRWVDAEGERTTPTGAALVTVLGTSAPPVPMTLEAVGTGAGTRELDDVPNLARIFIGCPQESPRTAWAGAAGGDTSSAPAWGWQHDKPDTCPGRWGQVVCLEAQFDDATAEQLALWAQRLQAAGALDVMLAPVVMKKGRPGTLLTVVARPERERDLIWLLLTESATIGVRRRFQWRRELERRLAAVQTPYGAIDVKWVWRGSRWHGKPEFESCRAAAEASGVSFAEVWQAAWVGIHAQESEQGHESPDHS